MFSVSASEICSFYSVNVVLLPGEENGDPGSSTLFASEKLLVNYTSYTDWRTLCNEGLHNVGPGPIYGVKFPVFAGIEYYEFFSAYTLTF